MKTILIVEPNTLVAEDVAEMLMDRWPHYRAIVTSSASEGLAALARSGAVDIAVLHVSRTDPQGPLLLSQLSDLGARIVIVDDAGAPAMKGAAEAELMSDVEYIAQPFSSTDMLEAVARAQATGGDRPDQV